MTATPNATDDAAKALNLAMSVISELNAKRDSLLLRGDMAAVEEVDGTLEQAVRHARRCRDRVKLIEDQAQRAERQRQAKELKALVGRLEQKLARRDELALTLETAITGVVQVFHEIAELGDEIRAAWPGCTTPDAAEAITTPGALQRAVAAELYRISGVDFLGGGAIYRGPPQFPGAAPLSALTPSRSAVEPLAVRMAAASAFASRQMRQVLPQQEGESR